MLLKVALWGEGAPRLNAALYRLNAAICPTPACFEVQYSAHGCRSGF